MQVSDLTSLLIYVASGGAAVVASKLLEQFAWFQTLAPNGKLASVLGASVVLTLVAVFLQGVIARNPFVNDAIDPYVKALLPLVNLFIAQVAHGMGKVQTERARALSNGSGQ